jgi:hypothetical protein
MSQTPNLLITEIDANQSQKEVTANNAFVELDGAITALLSVSMTDADYTLSATEGGEALGHAAFTFSGTLSADRHIIVPATPKSYLVQNNTSAGGSPSADRNLIVKTSGGSGVTVGVSSTDYVAVYCDGTNVLPVGVPGGGSSSLAGDSDVDITSPANGDVLTYNTGASKWENQAPSGGSGAWSAATAKRQLIVNLANMIWETGLAASATPPGQVLGTDVDLMGSIYNTWQQPDATHGGAVVLNNSSADNLAGIRTYNTTSYAPVATGQNIELWGSMYITATTDGRFWFGLGSNLVMNAITLGGSDTPSTSSADYIGFRYSTVAGDSNWQCVVSNGFSGSGPGIGDTVVDSGIAADTHSHRFAFVVNDSIPNVAFYIDGTLVATVTTHVPGTGNGLGYIAGAAYHSSAGMRLGCSSLIIQSDF